MNSVRCCFVSPFARAQLHAKKEPFQEATSIDYPLGTETIIRIPGLCREFACEVLFEQDIDGKSVATLILDALLQVQSISFSHFQIKSSLSLSLVVT